MTDKPPSPFVGLDTALLRSTQPADSTEQPAEQAAPSSPKARKQASNDASTLAGRLAPEPMREAAQRDEDMIELIRKAVKKPGKEVSFVRLTPEEKAQLGDIVYTYKRQGKKTSENEINRIAINYLLEDYRRRGQQSIFAQVLEALLS